jgi:23S rRNA pseudouridine1911/1915/1917 synthase
MQTNLFTKEYITIVLGIFENKKGRIDAPIARKEGSIIERCVSEEGQRAITEYEVIREIGNNSLVKCSLLTGRTHQIRVHMSSIGTPILGDSVYGNPQRHITQVENEEVRALLMGIKRQMLHSKNIEFTHPVTGEKMHFKTRLPDDMLILKDILDNE